jgi:hypothetical protein
MSGKECKVEQWWWCVKIWVHSLTHSQSINQSIHKKQIELCWFAARKPFASAAWDKCSGRDGISVIVDVILVVVVVVVVVVMNGGCWVS